MTDARALVAAFVLLGLGCGSSQSGDGGGDSQTEGTESAGSETNGTETADETETTETAGTTEGETGETGWEGGCHEVDEWCGEEYTSFNCASPQPCNEVRVLDMGGGGGSTGGPSEHVFEDRAAADCVLAALRDRTRATHVMNLYPGQQFSYRFELESLGDGTVIVRRDNFEDLNCSKQESWLPLLAVEDFEACLQDDDDHMVWDNCLVAPGLVDECVDAQPLCPE